MIQLRIDGLERLRAALRGMPAELRLEQRKGVSAAAALVRDEAARRVHSPGGHARKGMKIKVKGSGVDMSARIYPGTRAAIFSQRSRGAGTTPPPLKAARAMAKRYRIPREKARALALVIARRGTRGRPVMADALAAVRGRAEAVFRAALERVARKAAAR